MEGAVDFVKNNGVVLFFGLLLITALVVMVYNAVRGNPETVKMIAKTNFETYGKVTRPTPLGISSSDKTSLCDYYMASSAYSVFPGNTPYDYISDTTITLAIKAGARLVEVDVYAGDNDVPVVGLKNETVGYDYAKNSVLFESCCVAVANTAFNGVETPLSSDPFVFSIVFHTDKRNVIDACGTILKNTCQRYMLGPSYAFKGQGNKNLALEPMTVVAGKLIIVSGGNINGTEFEELVNLSWNTSNLRRLTYLQASQPYDEDELIEANRTHITMVVPDANPDLRNNNPTILFSYGCQWNLMNYGSLDDMMELYIGQFQQGSLVLKPEALRHKPVEAKTPVLPDPATHSFQPMATTSPIYDSNPVTGEKAIII